LSFEFLFRHSALRVPDDLMMKLSPRENEVFTFLIQGVCAKEIESGWD
jgi:FixJ family two-component response regulator